jgi:hypothetical protein
MSRRQRTVAYGSALLVAVAGGVVAAIVGGEAGQLLAIGFLSIGLGAVVLLVFYELGLSEDRERAREEERSRQRDQPDGPEHGASEGGRPRDRRLGRPEWRRPRRPS